MAVHYGSAETRFVERVTAVQGVVGQLGIAHEGYVSPGTARRVADVAPEPVCVCAAAVPLVDLPGCLVVAS